MATDKLINSSQGDDIITALEGIATAIPSINTTTEIPSSQVVAMTGYAKSTAASPAAIATDDTLNVAIGKLEKKVDNNATAIGGKADSSSLGTAAAKDVPVSGNASTSQVVMGDDSRLTDSRTPTAHDQASSTINAMTGYTAPTNPTTWQTVSSSDSLNQATQKIVNNSEINKTNILLFQDHFKFDSSSKTYYMQQTQPANPAEGDIWIG